MRDFYSPENRIGNIFFNKDAISNEASTIYPYFFLITKVIINMISPSDAAIAVSSITSSPMKILVLPMYGC